MVGKCGQGYSKWEGYRYVTHITKVFVKTTILFLQCATHITKVFVKRINLFLQRIHKGVEDTN